MNLNEERQRSLDQHKIVRVEYFMPRAIYPRLHGKNAIKGYHGFGGALHIARLTTDQGASGWATLCRKITEAKKVEEKLLHVSLGTIFRADTGILDDTLLPFDIALHDLAGRILNIPVSRMIQEKAVNSVKAYDGAIYMNDIIPEDKPFGPDKVLADCAHDYALGHRSMKVKIGRGHMWMEHEKGLKRDIEIVRAIHAAFPDVMLLVDANDGYTPEDCYAFLDGIDNTPLYWFEEPFRECESKNRALRDYLDKNRPATLIADGESFTDIPLLMDLAEKKLLDVWMPDVCGYGFTAWRKLLQQIVPLGYLSSPHAWGEVVKTHYCCHLAAAYPQFVPIVETVLGYTEGIDYSGYTLKNGFFTVPEKPGFGMDLIWAEEVK